MNGTSTLTYFGISLAAFGLGFAVNWLIESRKIMKAKNKAAQILRNAKKDADNIMRDSLLESKEAILKVRNEFEKEMRESKREQMNTDRRLQQRQNTLDRKLDQIEQRENEFEAREKELQHQMDKAKASEKRYEDMLSEQIARMEKIANMSSTEAKDELKNQLYEQARNESAMTIKKIDDQAKAEAHIKAQKTIGLAIQRCAADTVAESTVSVVPLEGDEMKGRIIGREGRNIKAIETLTGVDLIIDDTPEAVILSCYDPIKREIARRALEKLIHDGRIHPARIEDIINKVKKELDRAIIEEGEKAALEVGCDGIHPEIIKSLGRLKYRTSYSQNVLLHSKEVAYLAGMMAAELGLDEKVARRAGLLHDIGKATSHEVEGKHTTIGADLARRYQEKPIVINSIESHHEDVEAESVIATLVAAADALSASRPGARSEMLEAYVKRLKQLEEITNSFAGVEKTFAIQAGREIRVSVLPDKIDDGKAYILAKDIAKKIENEMSYPGEIKVTVIRETRVTEFAR
ncbi:MAG: ribonuclease Y [Nitrospinota bacterium]|nr:ribonuclease Y [Nitrospinota bacterium]